MAKATFILPDGSRYEAETSNVSRALEEKVFPKLKLKIVTREIVLSTKPENPAETKLLQAVAFFLASKGRSCHLKPHKSGISIVSACAA